MTQRGAQGWLAAYLAAVAGLGFVHDARLLGLALVLAWLAAGRDRSRLLWRSLRAILAFNLCVSLGYLAEASWQGEVSWPYLLLVNLRVVLLVFLGFWFVDRVNILRALVFSPTLSLMAAIAAAQTAVFRRIAADFRQAGVSRGLGLRPPWRTRLRQGAALSAHLLDKSVAGAERSVRALRARGAFDD